MSNTKMLIDATHPEETRVVVQRNGRVEEFDFESAARKLLRGNIYLAKVTRVEPSLQAAFVDYGGNRHGFLAFNEIHPDYYQIPVADRLALIEEEAAAEAELEAAADRRAEALERRARAKTDRQGRTGEDAARSSVVKDDEDHEADEEGHESDADDEASHIIDVEDDDDDDIEELGGDDDDGKASKIIAADAADVDDIISEDAPEASAIADEEREQATLNADGQNSADTDIKPHHHEAEDDEDANDDETSAPIAADRETPKANIEADAENDDADDHSANDHSDSANHADHDDSNGVDFHDEAPVRPRRRPRSYKIQEVIKRRQVILVQVVKEERGNKGAALTTYLSLAGRYTVLMPNTARGGGISRKITNPQDRKRLKAIANELDVPEGMGLIIRTAGAARTKQEIKRDFEYLLRLWESVRELTLQSTAPSLVYEEGDLIKRSIRDLYNKDVEEVVVAGDEGYDEAAAFMHMLMPSHAKNVVQYKGPSPLFTSYGVERQLNAMFLPQVTLRSGGYIVINQTEALVAIDVNSGKSTREFSIEETALATNLEAADEIARQLKLRDLAGLIVIDFIDMEEKRNNRAVERRLKDALRHDRARIQLGRISHFGLMEMSRQRLRTGVLEGSTSQCPHCQGTGIIRSTESIALAVLRGLEDAINAGANTPLIATTTPAVALYILNSKRAYITDMEERHGYTITVVGSERVQGANFTVERGAASSEQRRRPERAAVNMDWGFEAEGEDDGNFPPEPQDVSESDDSNELTARDDNAEDGGNRRRRRRRRGRGRGGRDRNDDGDRTESRMNGAGESHDDDGDGEFDSPRSEIEIVDGEDNEMDVTASDELKNAGDDEGRKERSGRRRRRGRRGGRRSRESATNRDGDGDSDAELELSEEPNQDDHQLGDSSDDDHQTPIPAAANDDSGESERTGQRHERIWDLPQSTDADAAEADTRESSPPRKANGRTAKHTESQEAVESPPAPIDESVEKPIIEAVAIKRRHEGDSTELRLERVVVRPDENGTVVENNEPQPQRKGWWQRRFGGE